MVGSRPSSGHVRHAANMRECERFTIEASCRELGLDSQVGRVTMVTILTPQSSRRAEIAEIGIVNLCESPSS